MEAVGVLRPSRRGNLSVMRQPLLAILALMGFVCAAIFGFAPITRAGVQCPTAPVQTVVAKDCCGRTIRRAPKPGGPSVFSSAPCAEKRTASQKGHLRLEGGSLGPPRTSRSSSKRHRSHPGRRSVIVDRAPIGAPPTDLRPPALS